MASVVKDAKDWGFPSDRKSLICLLFRHLKIIT